MTQKGKCDTCRLRKVKCDEARPKCHNCKSKGRICSYRAATASALGLGRHTLALDLAERLTLEPVLSSDGLQLVTSTDAASGSGKFATFATASTIHAKSISGAHVVAANSPSKALTSPSSRLAAKWVWGVGRQPTNSNPFQVFGDIVLHLPKRLGTSPTLDLAAEYLLDSHKAFHARSEEATTVARNTGLKALNSLRRLSAQQSLTTVQDDLLWTALLHYIAEQLVAWDTHRHTFHINAFAALVASRPIANESSDSLTGSILAANYYAEIEEAITGDRDSVLDDSTLMQSLNLSQIGYSTDHELAERLVMQQFVRIPRLARWVRSVQAREESKKLETKISSLALSLYKADPGTMVQQALAGEMFMVERSGDHQIEMAGLPYHMHFTSIRSFILYLDYHCHRLLLLGCMQTIVRLGIPLADVAPAVLGDLDTRSALAIMSAVDYASKVDMELPLATLRIGGAMQLAYGAWDRLERRLEANGDLQSKAYELSTYMRDYCLDFVNRGLATWCSTPHTDSHTQLRAIMDAVAGGQLHPWLLKNPQLD